MILVDTSVWIDYFRYGDAALAGALEAGQIWMHSLVLGELACGNLGTPAARSKVLSLLQGLPAMPVSTDSEALFLIEQHELMGKGIGYIDVHLLASVRLQGARLWTRDKRLHTLAIELDVAHAPTQH